MFSPRTLWSSAASLACCRPALRIYIVSQLHCQSSSALLQMEIDLALFRGRPAVMAKKLPFVAQS